MEYLVFGQQVQLSPAAGGASSTTAPLNCASVYISSDQTLRVTVDGITTATASIGLFCPAGTTTLLAAKAGTTVSLFNTGASAANVSVQFLGT